MKNILYKFIKRLFDIIIGIIGCFFVLIFSVFIKVCYVFNKDYDSIFYTQKRIGLNGKEFKLYKFRTMVKDADKELKELLKIPKYKREWSKYQKLEDDPRITKVGGFLRKTSLDEFPQFINVLKGDMSVFGPRPLVKGELSAHGGNHKLYESVKPGISGWWAVNGRNTNNYEERLKLEYYYIKNQSLLLDTKIFFKTFIEIFKKNGK